MKHLSLLCFFLCHYICYSQSPTTVTLEAVQNAYTDTGNPSSPNYTSTNTSVYVTSTSYYRAFYKFNLDSIPSNAVILSAMLILTPSGTENIIASGSNELSVDACNSSWTEIGLTHNSGISNNVILLPVTSSNLNVSTGKREIQLGPHVQAMVDGRVPNYGWRIKRSPESTATLITRYVSRIHGNASLRPKLEVKYYIPAYVSAATIVHATSGSSNGSISPTILKGSSLTRSYQWYSAGAAISGVAGTSLNLTSRPAGWYGLKSWSTTVPEDTLFQAFLIGSKCEMIDISFNPGPDYIDDAFLYGRTQGSGLTIADYRQNNYATYATSLLEQWSISGSWYTTASIMKFKLWIDPALEVNEAKLTLYGLGHNPLSRPNDSKLTQVLATWKETGISFYNRPAVGSAFIPIPNMPSGNGNSTVELKDFFNTWKTNNQNNFGLDFSLQSYPDPSTIPYTKLCFQSSDNTSKPIIAFKVSLVNNTCDFTSYSRFRDVLDGSFVRTIQGKLKIQFNEDYDQKAGRFAKLVLYDAATNIRKAGINNDGSIIASGIPLLPAKLLEYDYNQHLLDLSTYSLVIGNDYILELTTSKGEKSYIKFKYYN